MWAGGLTPAQQQQQQQMAMYYYQQQQQQQHYQQQQNFYQQPQQPNFFAAPHQQQLPQGYQVNHSLLLLVMSLSLAGCAALHSFIQKKKEERTRVDPSPLFALFLFA